MQGTSKQCLVMLSYVINTNNTVYRSLGIHEIRHYRVRDDRNIGIKRMLY